jgi:hypothetical protein
MSSEQTDPNVTRLYHLAAREQAPAALDAPILQAAERHARRRRLRTRLPWIAAAPLAALLIARLDRPVDSGSTTIASGSVASPRAQDQVRHYLLDLRIAGTDRSTVSACLRSREVCTRPSAADMPIEL